MIQLENFSLKLLTEDVLKVKTMTMSIDYNPTDDIYRAR